MYASILVPLDGSPFAERALPMAIALARRSDARLSLVHVDGPDVSLFGLPAGPRRDAEIKSGLHRALETLANRIRAQHGLETDVTCLEGSVGPTLTQCIVASGADLIVMSTHGSGGLSRAWLGSVADHLVRHSSIPLLLVRPGAIGAARGEPLFRHVLVPLDGSSLAERVLEHAVTLATPRQTAFTLLQVVVPWSMSAPRYSNAWSVEQVDLARRVREAASHLERPRAELTENGFEATAEAFGSPSIARSILDYARKHDVDLITIATHGRGGVRRLLMGSVADKILRGARTPLMIYHPPATDDVVSPLTLAESGADHKPAPPAHAPS